jgi:transcriptional regulator with XRE-family HTH domain
MLLVGQKVKKIRELKNLKQEIMAEKLNMSQSAYSRLEKDEVKVDLDILEKVAEIFDMKVEDILRFDEKVNYFINNNGNYSAGPNYGTINDLESFSKLLMQINDRIERQWKEIEKLKESIKKAD